MCNDLIYPDYIIYGAIYSPLNDTVCIQLITVIEISPLTRTIRNFRQGRSPCPSVSKLLMIMKESQRLRFVRRSGSIACWFPRSSCLQTVMEALVT